MLRSVLLKSECQTSDICICLFYAWNGNYSEDIENLCLNDKIFVSISLFEVQKIQGCFDRMLKHCSHLDFDVFPSLFCFPLHRLSHIPQPCWPSHKSLRGFNKEYECCTCLIHQAVELCMQRSRPPLDVFSHPLFCLHCKAL